MAEIRAFQGIRYDAGAAGNLDQIISPPYDVIDPELQKNLYERSPYNVVRVDYGAQLPDDTPSENRYTRARATFREWLEQGVLKVDKVPALYYQEEEYRDDRGDRRVRKGVLASVRLEDPESGLYRPHEKTLARPKEDRLALTKACQANLSPIFSLYDEPERAVLAGLEAAAKSEAPAAEVTNDDGVVTRLWVVQDPGAIEAASAGMTGKSFFIADGHHRYETGLAYRDWMREQHPDADASAPWNHVMMYLSNMHEPGLTIFPTHRAVFGLAHFDMAEFLRACAAYFAVEEVPDGSGEELASRLQEDAALGLPHRFGVCGKEMGRSWLLALKRGEDVHHLLGEDIPDVLKTLDVTILHSLILDRILGIGEEAQIQQKNLRYVKGTPELLRRIREDSDIQVGFLLNPTRIEEVKRVAESGCRMPQKSTYFYPKLMTGLVMHPLTKDLSAVGEAHG